MLPSDQRPKISVEDLLHLKRAERPSAEFWTNFERELRQKQLTALLEKRSWWRDLPQFLARRAYLPVGATAILAFTLVSVRYYTPVQLTQVDGASSAGSSLTVRQPVKTPADDSATAPVSSPLVNRSAETAPLTADRTMAVAPVVEAPARIATSGSMLSLIAPATVETPSSRFIAAKLDQLEKSDPELVQAVMGSHLSVPSRPQVAAASVAELASVPANAFKRSRLLAQYSGRPLNPEPTAPDLVRERLARRLGDSEITDRISRIGLKGDQVSLGLTLRL